MPIFLILVIGGLSIHNYCNSWHDGRFPYVLPSSLLGIASGVWKHFKWTSRHPQTDFHQVSMSSMRVGHYQRTLFIAHKLYTYIYCIYYRWNTEKSGRFQTPLEYLRYYPEIISIINETLFVGAVRVLQWQLSLSLQYNRWKGGRSFAPSFIETFYED